jgi:hypothetical protein
MGSGRLSRPICETRNVIEILFAVIIASEYTEPQSHFQEKDHRTRGGMTFEISLIKRPIL